MVGEGQDQKINQVFEIYMWLLSMSVKAPWHFLWPYWKNKYFIPSAKMLKKDVTPYECLMENFDF